MIRPPRILLTITNVGMGGAPRVFHDHGVLLAEQFTVEEVVFNFDGGNLFPSGNPITSLNIGGGGGPITKFRNFLSRVRALGRIKREKKIDVSISHLEGADYVNVLSRGREKIILVVHGSKVRDPQISGLLGVLRRKVLIPLLYNRSDRVVVVSRDLIDEVAALGVRRDKIVAINNFFDAAAIERLAGEPLDAAEEAIFIEHNVIVTAGRLAVQKNHRGLIEIFFRVRPAAGARLVILGDGDLRDGLIEQARQLGLSVYDIWSGGDPADAEVLFLGTKSNPFKYIKRSAVFVLPSDTEGFPLALCEAMICGVPVVSSDCLTGPREILAPRTHMPDRPIEAREVGEYGILMPMLGPAPSERALDTWAKTLTQLLGDPAERARLGAAAALRMRDFGRSKIARQWIDLIEEVVADQSGALPSAECAQDRGRQSA